MVTWNRPVSQEDVIVPFPHELLNRPIYKPIHESTRSTGLLHNLVTLKKLIRVSVREVVDFLKERTFFTQLSIPLPNLTTGQSVPTADRTDTSFNASAEGLVVQADDEEKSKEQAENRCGKRGFIDVGIFSVCAVAVRFVCV
ncbi:hypothetical protein N7474_000171 [Penicillium riverlandense]|uniref:uncharacterized protein n=1 Tax=Penicillium riverlandense TaxID=1903569 RepID=UPI002547E345|nr:uncharacterized protein N7474_000171 [Penicillium riverlandense]KAJ5831860.1 hypothetical protein N7474_000171 [Penicillium riverlandense]